MRLVLRILIPFAVATAIIYAWLGGGSLPPRAPSPDVEPPPHVEPVAPRPPEATTGTLVIRVVTKDGKDLPESTRAGYVRAGGADRLRPAGPDGTIRFSELTIADWREASPRWLFCAYHQCCLDDTTCSSYLLRH